MKGTRSLSGILYLLMSMAVSGAALLVTPVVCASDDRDDWRLVSAPPPPGPYRVVNLDPRVPGQAGIPGRGDLPRFPRAMADRTPETTGAAPATRRRADYQAPVNRVPVYQAPMKRLPKMQPPVKRVPVMQAPMNQPAARAPRSYQERMYRPPANNYPGPSEYPGEMGGQDAGTMAPRGYYPSQPYPAEEEVPPPPVYDAMMKSPPGAYQSGAGR